MCKYINNEEVYCKPKYQIKMENKVNNHKLKNILFL